MQKASNFQYWWEKEFSETDLGSTKTRYWFPTEECERLWRKSLSINVPTYVCFNIPTTYLHLLQCTYYLPTFASMYLLPTYVCFNIPTTYLHLLQCTYYLPTFASMYLLPTYVCFNVPSYVCSIALPTMPQPLLSAVANLMNILRS